MILAVNGQTIDHYGELSLTISNLHPGADARLSVWRGGRAQDMTVRIAVVNEDQDKTAANKSAKGGPASGQAERFGLTVRALGADEKSQAQTDGALVVETVAGPAAQAGVQPGDIILGINGKPIRSTVELLAAAKSAGKTVALLIQRQDQQIFVPLRLN